METTPFEPIPETTPTIEPSVPSPVRGTFLTVICILTFIGSGWGLLGAISGYMSADSTGAITSGVIQNAQDQMSQQDTPAFFKDLFNSVADDLTPGKIRKSSLINIISNLFTLFGGVMMWKLKKQGFYLYVTGIVILIACPLMVMGKFLGILSAIGSGFFGVVFIIMYAVNLKEMNS